MLWHVGRPGRCFWWAEVERVAVLGGGGQEMWERYDSRSYGLSGENENPRSQGLAPSLKEEN